MRTLIRRKNCLGTKTKRNGREKKTKKGERVSEIGTKNKELTWIKKTEKDKREEKEMWARLKELNHNLEKMKEQKTLDNKKKKLYFP